MSSDKEYIDDIMEVFLRCYLDQFNELPRNTLHDRRKRKYVVDYISTLIEGCTAVEPDTQESCRIAIKTIIQYHEEKKGDNGKVCMMGKYHNILYVAMKLCFDWQLNDIGTVGALLEHIYACEKTFERIFVGAIFGNKAPHYIAAWKSDFESEEENLRAVIYFIDKANDAGLELEFNIKNEVEKFRFVDLPIESCGKASPVKVTIQLGLPDKLLIFLRFGARILMKNEGITVFEHILNRLSEFNHVYPYNLVACLQLLLRVVPSISFGCDFNSNVELYKLYWNRMYEKYSDLIKDGIIPLNRCGINPPELKHLSRCVIRDQLWLNYQLPNGIRQLPLPENLWRYLDILED